MATVEGNFRIVRPAAALAFTGERMTSAVEGQIEFEHLHRYCLARDLCAGRDVLDIASGEGYGSAILAGVARSVVGVEIDAPSVAHAREAYALPNLRFEVGDALDIPLPDAVVDVVVCFETIEHVDDPRILLEGIRRVLRPGGLLVISTPERAVYSAPGSDVNPYHRLEYTEAEFAAAIGRHFERAVLLRQRPILGSAMVPTRTGDGPARSYERRSAEVVEASAGLSRAPYVIAVASDGELPALGPSHYLDRRNVHRVCEDLARLPHLEARLAEAERTLSERVQALEAEARERSALAATLEKARRDLDTAARRESALTYDVEDLRAALARFRDMDARVVEAAAETARLQAELERERAAAQYLRGVALAEAEASLQVAHAEIERREQALRDHRAALEAERAHAADLASRLAAVLGSTSWKALAPLRVAGQRMPRAARTARRAAKLLWWTTTLQLGTRWLARRAYLRTVAAEQARESVPQIAAPSAEAAAPVPAPEAEMSSPAPAPHAAEAVTVAAENLRNRYQAIHFPRAVATRVSVIIPVYGGAEDLAACLRSMAATVGSEPGFEVILADDKPDDRATAGLPPSPGLRVLDNPTNLGFLRTCNRASARAEAEFLLFLNSDTLVTPGWLSSLVSAMEEDPRTGIAGSMLLNTDGTIQDAGWRIGGDGWGIPLGRGAATDDSAHAHRREADCVTGASLLVRRSVFEALGGFDEVYAPAFYEEFDLAFRARARGWRTVYEPGSRVMHLGSASYGAAERDRLSTRNNATFVRRFAERLRRQPWADAPEFLLRRAADTGPAILVVDDTLPWPDRHAGGVTLFQYMNLMAEAGWRVIFAPHDGIVEGRMGDALRRRGIEVLPGGPGTIAAWLRRNGQHLHYAWLARPAVAPSVLPAIRAHSPAFVAYYTHDLHHHRLRQEAKLNGNDPAALAEADAMEKAEVEVFRAVDCVMSCNEDESGIIRTLAPGTRVVTVPPYYVDAAVAEPRAAAFLSGLKDVVFVGGFPHTPNVDAALFIAHEVMPLVWERVPEARLLLIGYNPPPELLALANERVVVTGQVPDLAPYFLNARLSLAALRYGAGVKGKVVQALQFGTPLVTTTVGAEGLGLVSGENALIADDAAGLAEATVSLLLDAERAALLGASGMRFIQARLSRPAMRQALDEVYGGERCRVCGSANLFVSERPTSREGFVCRNCFALVRTAALACILVEREATDGCGSLAEMSRRGRLPRLLEIGFVGAIAETLRGDPAYQDCEYFEEVIIGGRSPDAVRSEDVTRLTFPDGSFDVVISQEVMEHVPDPRRGFEEMRRVLRPGGRLFFTIPVDWNRKENITRVAMEGGQPRFLLKPEYDGDPLRQEGALVFTDWGTDAVDFVASCGFEVRVHRVQPPGAAIASEVFEAVRAA